MNWTTKIEAINIETGEIIPVEQVEQGVYELISKKIIANVIINNHGQRKIRWHCKPTTNRQLKLWD